MATRHLARGVVSGMVGGLVASWMMNEFIAGPGVGLRHAVQTDAENAAEAKAAEQSQAEPKEDATMKVADRLVSAATGGQHLTFAQEQVGGPIVHYTFGALMGGLYGGLAEYSTTVSSGLGSSFGSVLFAAADLVGVPVLNLSELPTQQPASALATPFAAHLVYGVTTDLVRRFVRAML